MKNVIVSFCFLFLAISWSFAQNENKTTSKFDFITGEKVVFYDDFTNDNIGDFPANWNTNGSGEIVTSEKLEGRWLKITKQGYLIPEVKDNFTENYTVEFDIFSLEPFQGQLFATTIYLLSADLLNPQGGAQPGKAGLRIRLENERIGWNNWSEAREWGGDEGVAAYNFDAEQKFHFAFWFQKQRVRLYINNSKVLDLPRGLNSGYTYNIFRIDSDSEEIIPMIANYRMAVGLPDMRNKLLTEGKLISYGILFDVNSDKLRPESQPVIKEIGTVLKDNPTVKIKIIGHTDADGVDAANLDLSKRRSLSVKNELVDTYKIEAARIETDGKGESQPLAPNDSAINKAKNRRVEFVKL
ncbi:MAG: OmpA family protein [Cytophagaceae bacterium]|nr:OmpA family protein [Cytophagaceae bacterium]